MNQKQKETLLVEMKLLNRHLRRPQSNDEPYRRFINWYIDARFGKRRVSKTFLDGSNDRGIDAVVETLDETFFLQSKYEVAPRLSNVPPSELRHFSHVIDLLSRKEDDPDRIGLFSKFKSDSRFSIQAAR